MLLEDFILHALAAGGLLCLVSGPLGAFVIWQRMAYFGDTLAHSALLGVAIGLWLHIDTELTIIGACLALALALNYLQRNPQLSSDSLLGILSHGSLALGLLAVASMNDARLDLNSYLFGDLLAVSKTALWQLALGTTVLLILLLRYWKPLLTVTVHRELAQVEGLPVQRLQLLLMLMIALLVAMAMKILGVLLITALLIIPAAAARRFARSPEQMALGATLIGMLSVIAGLALSLQWDSPAGPSVVVSALAFFALSTAVFGHLRRD